MYLWNAATGDILQLCQTTTPDCYIGSVAWIKEGNFVALGDSNGVVQVGHALLCMSLLSSSLSLLIIIIIIIIIIIVIVTICQIIFNLCFHKWLYQI